MEEGSRACPLERRSRYGNQGAAGYSGAKSTPLPLNEERRAITSWSKGIGGKRYIETHWSHWIDMALVPCTSGTGEGEMKFSNCLLNLVANRWQPNGPCLFQIELKVFWSRGHSVETGTRRDSWSANTFNFPGRCLGIGVIPCTSQNSRNFLDSSKRDTGLWVPWFLKHAPAVELFDIIKTGFPCRVDQKYSRE